MRSLRELIPPLRDLFQQALRVGMCDWSMGKTADTGALPLADEIGLDGVEVSLTVREDGEGIDRIVEMLSQPGPKALETEEEASALRLSTSRGRPLGTDSVLSQVEGAFGPMVRPLPVGRPRKLMRAHDSTQQWVAVPGLRHHPCGWPRVARGRGGSLLLPRRALLSPTPCRFIPALLTVPHFPRRFIVSPGLQHGCPWPPPPPLRMATRGSGPWWVATPST